MPARKPGICKLNKVFLLFECAPYGTRKRIVRMFGLVSRYWLRRDHLLCIKDWASYRGHCSENLLLFVEFSLGTKISVFIAASLTAGKYNISRGRRSVFRLGKVPLMIYSAFSSPESCFKVDSPDSDRTRIISGLLDQRCATWVPRAFSGSSAV